MSKGYVPARVSLAAEFHRVSSLHPSTAAAQQSARSAPRMQILHGFAGALPWCGLFLTSARRSPYMDHEDVAMFEQTSELNP
jgi:hypothetical protein